MRLEASVARGLGAASGMEKPTNGTIFRQRPLVVKYFSEIENCYNGTINLQLNVPLQVRLPDIVTPPFRWNPDNPDFDEPVEERTHAIERLHEEFKRRIKTQTVLPSADTAAMLFWALLASGQINMRKVDGWQTLAIQPIDQPIDLGA